MALVDGHIMRIYKLDKWRNKSLRELIDKAQRRDSRSQRLLIMNLKNELYSLCFLLSADLEIACRLFEKIGVRILRDLGHTEEFDNLQVWVYSICSLTIEDSPELLDLRRSSNLVPDQLDGPRFIATSYIRIAELVQSLEPDQRFLIYLIDIRKMSRRDTAAILRLSEDVIKRNLYSARRALAKAMKNGLSHEQTA